MNFQRKFYKTFFTKLLEDHRIPTNTDINERLWTGRFPANGTSLRLNVGTGFYIQEQLRSCEIIEYMSP